jgi:DNA invertase Pin-like site-specific DNA recombinase
MPTVVSYARISREEAGTGKTVKEQTAECAEYAAERGWPITRAYIDNDITITRRSTKPRKDFNHLFAAIKAGQIDVIVVTEAERLYRRPRELEDLIDVAEAGQPVKIICSDGREYDLGITTGKHDLRQHVINAAREADKISDRTRRKKAAHARDGRPSGGHRAFGFEQDLVTIRAGEAELIRQAAARLIAGDSLRSVCRDWTAKGVTSPTGLPWAPTALKRALLSPRLRGLRQHQGVVLGPAAWPAILDEETAELVARILTSPDRAITKFTGRSYLLTSILECGGCGAKLYGGVKHFTSDRADRMYSCKGGAGFQGCDRVHQLAEPLEVLIAESVLDALDSPEMAERMRPKADNEQAAVLFDRLQADKARLTLLGDDYGDGTIDKPMFVRQKARLSERIETVGRALDQIAAARTVTSLPPAGQVRTEWEKASTDRRRAIIAAVVEKVLIHPAGSGRRRIWRDPESDFGWGFNPELIEIRWAV